MPLDSSRTINAFQSGYGIGKDYRERLKKQKFADILAKSYDPGMTQEQISATPEMIRAPGIQPREPGFNFLRAAPELAREGFAPELIALQQSQQKLSLENRAALIDAMLKGAQYEKTRATTISPVDLEREKSSLRKQELAEMLKSLGFELPKAPSGPAFPSLSPGSPPQITPNGAGFTKNINGKLYVKIGPNSMDWAEWGEE